MSPGLGVPSGLSVSDLSHPPVYQRVLSSVSGPAVCDDRWVSSAVCHTGRPLLRCSVCFPGDAALLFKAEESRGLMCQHPGFPRGGVALTLFQKEKKKPDAPLKTVLFLLAGSS